MRKEKKTGYQPTNDFFGFNFQRIKEDFDEDMYLLKTDKSIYTGTGLTNKLINSKSLEALDILNRQGFKSDVIFMDVSKERLIFNDKETTMRTPDLANKWYTHVENRAKLIKKIMSKRSVLFVSVDDRYVSEIKIILKQILGSDNFLSCMTWYKPEGSSPHNKYLNTTKEYVLVFKSKGLDAFSRKEQILSDSEKGTRMNKLDRLKKYTGSNDYPIPVPDTNGEFAYAGGSKEGYDERQKGIHNSLDWRWMLKEDKFNQRLENGDVIFKKDKEGHWKVYNSFNKLKTLPFNDYVEASTYRRGKEEVEAIFKKMSARTVKPIDFYKFLVNLHPDEDIHVLDINGENASLGLAVFEMNNEDGFNRTFTLIADVNHDGYLGYFAYERLSAVIKGYKCNKSKLIVKGVDSNLTVFNAVKKTSQNQTELFQSSLFLMHNVAEEEVLSESLIRHYNNLGDSVFILKESFLNNEKLKNLLDNNINLNRENTVYIKNNLKDVELSRELLALGLPNYKIIELSLR